MRSSDCRARDFPELIEPHRGALLVTGIPGNYLSRHTDCLLVSKEIIHVCSVHVLGMRITSRHEHMQPLYTNEKLYMLSCDGHNIGSKIIVQHTR